MPIKKFEDVTGGLNLTQSTQIEDNELTIARNVFYNNSKQLQTRRGYTTFGSQIGSDPVTSLFFYQRDDTLERILVCNSGDSFYSYDGSNWNSEKSGLLAKETLTGLTDRYTRRDYAVYKNVIYMGDGVNPYSKFEDWSFSFISMSSNRGCTFDNTTNYVERTSHVVTEWDEIMFVSGTMPAEINLNQPYYVLEVDADNFQIATERKGTAINFTDNGSGTQEYQILGEPRCRYIQYLSDRLYGAGDDGNPSTLYYTNAAPTNWENLNQNVLVVGWDEQGVLNGLSEYWQVVLGFKSDKVYGIDVANTNATAIDSQTGGYADRSIHVVGNSLAYFNDRGVDTLRKRSGVSGVNALESETLSEKVRDLVEQIEEANYNSAVATYVKPLNNYYFSFDTNWDDIPDTHLVYNSMVGAWTQYNLPTLYDYAKYKNSDKEVQYLFGSASGGQVYQFETGFNDNGTPIEAEIETKEFDFWDPAQLKMFGFVDITGYKQEWGEIEIKNKVDGVVESEWMVTDSNLDLGSNSGVIGADPIGTTTLWGDEESGLPMYKFTVKLPMYARGTNIAVNMSSLGVQRILEKIRIKVDAEQFTVFWYDNIL